MSEYVVNSQDPDVRMFKLLTSQEITNELKNLSKEYPRLCSLTTSQKAFGLTTAGGLDDCIFDKNEGCNNYFLTIEDKIAHPFDSESYQSLPEVFLSGAVHGNERVGPTTVVETAKLLLEAAWCEGMPSVLQAPADVNTEEGAEWLLQAEKGQDCRNDLKRRGIKDHQRQWLARLVTTRRIVVIPTANALGYDRSKREEDNIDPNRDFPFDILDPTQCMKSIAGRTINEIFRQHMFQIALTFHGGTEVVSYEWGAPTYNHVDSPDDKAQVEIGDGYSRFAGGFEGTKAYISGTMNDLVYAVRGGMEDWAYAGSWDPDRVIRCTPKINGSYDPMKTVYNESTLRAFNMLIETSNNKIPNAHLGSTESLLDYKASMKSNGHVARNIRLSLMAIDIVEPYVAIKELNGVPVTDDVVPMTNRYGSTCQNSKTMLVPSGQKEISVTWIVSGGFTVDYTTIIYTDWNDLPSSIECSSHPLDEELGSAFQTVQATNGVTRWHSNAMDGNGIAFTSTIDISAFQPGSKIAVFALARLDQAWTEQNSDNVKPEMPPMSHIVNARTSPRWRHESAGKVIQGRLDWYSIPLTVVISEDGQFNQIVELSNRFIIPDMDVKKAHNVPGLDEHDGESSPKSLEVGAFSLVAIAFIITFLLYMGLRKTLLRRFKKQRITIDEEDMFSNEFTFEEDIQLREMS